MNNFYDIYLNRLKEFYDLDNVTPVNIKDGFITYVLTRSPKDYEFISSFFNSDNCSYNISKIKQLSYLIDFFCYIGDVEDRDLNKKIHISIPMPDHGNSANPSFKIFFGHTLKFSFSRGTKDNNFDFVLYDDTFFKSDSYIDSVIFDHLYNRLLQNLLNFIDEDMTLKQFILNSKNTAESIQIEKLINKDLTHVTVQEFTNHFCKFDVGPDVLLKSLPVIFSKRLASEVKILEGLIRFESLLLYEKRKYELIFNFIRPISQFKIRDNLYSILFNYSDDIFLTQGLFFSLTSSVIGYMEVDYNTQESVTLDGYEAIYNHLFERIKNVLTKRLGIPAAELTDQSLLLYKMMLI